MVKIIQNTKTKATHVLDVSQDKTAKTLCGIELKNFKEVDQWPPSCEVCYDATVSLNRDSVSEDDPDPLGLIDDDISDGAYWAMVHEFYGG